MVTNFIKKVKRFYEEVQHTDLTSLSLLELKELNSKMIAFYEDPVIGRNDTEENSIYSSIAESILGYYSHFVRKTKYADEYRGFIDSILESIPEGIEKTKAVAIEFYKNVGRGIKQVIENNTVIESFERKIVLEANLDEYNYLYYYGKKVTKNQIQIVDFFNKNVSDETLDGIARCTVEAFYRGLDRDKVDLSNKKYFVLWYPMGFEKVARRINEIVDGKYDIIFRVDAGPFSKQVDYNHRYDYNLFMSEEYKNSYIDTFKKALLDAKERFSEYAGPVFIESFGENRFVPENGHEIFKKNDTLAKINADMDTKYSNLYWKYMRDNTSFCIISYPCPEIGEDFEEIFTETIKINTLDNAKYEKIHQYIIDVLDKAVKVRVTGRNGNETDLTVALTSLKDPEKETIFENCCADVNVPVGEVFTSPKLTGTNGTLHVSEIYLGGWKFENLNLKIEDGFIKEYSCSNYPTDEENNAYINEHLLFDHATLPMGEFAIGTNTYAYVMGNKYKINDKLDILIAEKTGPHFAFGDTCFSMDEDTETYNPDGKKIIAKDNEASIKRNSDDEKEREEAYFGCHTDVTIPYYELGDIVAIQADGTGVSIIHDGKFVLNGTEELNIDGM